MSIVLIAAIFLAIVSGILLVQSLMARTIPWLTLAIFVFALAYALAGLDIIKTIG